MTIDIVGSGLAGLLASNMLRRHGPVVYERQKELPSNHNAVLRFRTPQVGEALGLEFRKVSMIKTVLPWRNPVADALAYSFKNTGVRTSDRSVVSSQLVSEDRYIAPSNLIEEMARGQELVFGHEYEFGSRSFPIVSTLPMPVLMQILDYPQKAEIEFHSSPGAVIRATIPNCDAFVSLLVPDPRIPFSRISITGNELIVESMDNGRADILEKAIHMLGLEHVQDPRSYTMRYAKIVAIDEKARRDFMYWATDKHQIYSLGRFATWRPGLLMDDLVKDLRLIDGWLSRQDRYEVARSR